MEPVPNVATIDLDESRLLSRRLDPDRVADGLLDALEAAQSRATFFVPRSTAEKRPALVRRIAERGQEVASLTMEPPARAKPYCSTFCGELEATSEAIESATGVRVRGHRNAPFAVDYESEWTYDVLVERGLEYDSSRIPPRRVDFGYQPVPETAHAIRRWGGLLLELPVSTTDILAMRVRLGAAGTIRAWPMPVWSAVVNGRQARGEPVVMRLRASEMDATAVQRVGRIVKNFRFTSVAGALPDLYRNAPIIES